MSDWLLANIKANVQLPPDILIRKAKRRLDWYEAVRGGKVLFSFRSYAEIVAWADDHNVDINETSAVLFSKKDRPRFAGDKKKCVECGKVFSAAQNAQKLCSPECRKLWNRRYHQQYMKERGRRNI